MLGATFKLLQTNKEYQEGQSLRQHSAPVTQHISQEAIPASILQHHFVQLLVGYHMLGISVQHVLLDGYFHRGGAWWAFISFHSFLIHDPFTSWGAPYSPDPAWCLPLSTLSPQRGGRPRACAVFWQEPLLSPKRPQYHSYQTTASTSALLVKGARLHTSWDSTHDVIWLMLIWHLTRTHPLWPCFGRTHHFQCMKDVCRNPAKERHRVPLSNTLHALSSSPAGSLHHRCDGSAADCEAYCFLLNKPL